MCIVSTCYAAELVRMWLSDLMKTVSAFFLCPFLFFSNPPFSSVLRSSARPCRQRKKKKTCDLYTLRKEKKSAHCCFHFHGWHTSSLQAVLTVYISCGIQQTDSRVAPFICVICARDSDCTSLTLSFPLVYEEAMRRYRGTG